MNRDNNEAKVHINAQHLQFLSTEEKVQEKNIINLTADRKEM